MSVEWSELSSYLASELDDEAERDLERELFEGPGVTAVIATFLETIDAIALVRRRHGTLSGVLSATSLEALRHHARLTEVEIDPGQVVDCHIPEDSPLCVAHLRLPTTSGRRYDVEYVNGAGAVYFRTNDAPVDRASGRVIIACERHVALMEEVTLFRVVTTEKGARRVLGDYGVRNVPPLA